MLSNEMKVERGSRLLREHGGARRRRVYVSIAAACGLVGCHGTAPQTSPNTSPQPAPVATQTVTNLKGTWVGSLPPSSDGRTVTVAPDSGGVLAAMLQIDSSDLHGNSGKLSLCASHKTGDAGSFSNAQLGKSAVPLSGTTSAISLVNLSGDAGSLTVGLRSDESNLSAGVLHRGTESDFHTRCKI